jgi:hypothetical protein
LDLPPLVSSSASVHLQIFLLHGFSPFRNISAVYLSSYSLSQSSSYTTYTQTKNYHRYAFYILRFPYTTLTIPKDFGLSSAMSSQTFCSWGFSRLPTEIRLQIWLLTLPGLRALNFLTVRPESIIPDPVTLKVNYESRELALQYYSFRNNLGELGNKYINFEIDSLHYQPTVTDIMNPLYDFLLKYCYDERHSNAHLGLLRNYWLWKEHKSKWNRSRL